MYDIATATARVPAGSLASLVQVSFDAALGVAERYCDRKFLFAHETVVVTHLTGNVISIPRYPVEDVYSAYSEQGVSLPDYHLVRNVGHVVFDGLPGGHQIAIEYVGGYKTLPADLELALWMIFDQVWASSSAGAGAGASSGSGAISRITVPDVGSISFDTGASPVSGGAAMGGLIPPMAAGILDLYRREGC